eukprot:7008893-Pyramimonas_sp.AAC.1
MLLSYVTNAEVGDYEQHPYHVFIPGWYVTLVEFCDSRAPHQLRPMVEAASVLECRDVMMS